MYMLTVTLHTRCHATATQLSMILTVALTLFSITVFLQLNLAEDKKQ